MKITVQQGSKGSSGQTRKHACVKTKSEGDGVARGAKEGGLKGGLKGVCYRLTERETGPGSS